jgi:septal ring factor EnvC (AmiA/AmiB activator)
MKRLLFCLILSLYSYQHARADSDVYLCTDENGRKEYRNNGLTKGCKKIDLPGIMTVPAPVFKKSATAKTASAPADFPKVDERTQKARDSDRKQILKDELQAEEDKLAKQKKDYNNGEPERQGDEKNYAKYQDRVAAMKDEISRTEKNIDALKRELGNLQ